MLSDILRGLKPTPAAYVHAARRIETGNFNGFKPVNVGILSTFMFDVVRPYLVVEAAARGMLVRPYFAPFNQLEQEALDRRSPLFESHPDIVVIATRLEEIAPNLIHRFLALSAVDVGDELAQIEARIEGLVQGLRRFSTATILVFNYACPSDLAAGLADPFLEVSQSSVVQRANDRVARVCERIPGVYVFDYGRLVYEFGIRQWEDPKLRYLWRVPFGASGQLETGRRLARYLRALLFPPCKCLVVDADNTLWAGVIGEDGIGGIGLGEEYPGNVYKEFQRKLLSLRHRGVLLALASKNNESDVLEVFEKHPDCVLKPEDFAALQIHWQDKASSLVAIAKELNIGTDALAFFDDDRVEREWVRSQMPEVTVIEVPESALDFIRALEESGVFDHPAISAEDRARAEMYRKEQERRRLQAASVSLEGFLRQLDITATVGHVGKDTMQRVAQLLAKTNQFNLTTRRHTSSELQTMLEAGAVALWLRVVDRLGDNGVVGVAIAVPQDSSQWTIDTFLLSCRVIGRRVETALLSVLSRIVRERGGQLLFGEYIPTAKNGMVSGFYPAQGFEPVDGSGRVWKWDLCKREIPFPEHVRVRLEDGRNR